MARAKTVPRFKSEAAEIARRDPRVARQHMVDLADHSVPELRPERRQPVTLPLEPGLIAELKEVAVWLDVALADARAGVDPPRCARAAADAVVDHMGQRWCEEERS